VFFLGVFVGKYLFELTEGNIPSHHFDELSLLTWRSWTGDLCFLLVPRIEQGRVTHDFWSKWRAHQCGVAQLKDALLAVPKSKKVVWTNSPPRFELPSEKFCDDLAEFAKSKGIKFTINPTLDAEMFSDWEPR
jgi:hypothetical protein